MNTRNDSAGGTADFLFVKVARLGAAVVEVPLAEGATVQDAVDASGVNYSGLSFYLNAAPTTPGTEIEDGDIIGLAPKSIKGGQ